MKYRQIGNKVVMKGFTTNIEPKDKKDKFMAAVIRMHEYKEKSDVRRQIQDQKLNENNTFRPYVLGTNYKSQKKKVEEE